MARRAEARRDRGSRNSPKRNVREEKARNQVGGAEGERSRFGVTDSELYKMTELQLQRFALAVGIDDALSLDKSELLERIESLGVEKN